MIGFHEKFGFGAIKSIDNDIVKITFDGMSEKNIVRFKVNVLNEKFAKYIIDSKFSNEKYPNENLSDFSFHDVKYDELQNKFTLIDNYQNRIDIEFNGFKATTICSCIDTFDCIHGYAALEYLAKLLKKVDSFSKNVNFLINQIIEDPYDVNYSHIKSFIKNVDKVPMNKIVEALSENVKYIDQIEALTAGFIIDKQRRADYAYEVNALNKYNRYKESALPLIKRYEKIIKLDNVESKDSDRQSSVILYYYFNDDYRKIIEYINGRDLNQNAWDLIQNIIDEVCSKIPENERMELLNNSKLESYLYEDLINSFEPAKRYDLLANIDLSLDLSSDLYDYVPNYYLENKMKTGSNEVINYIFKHPERKISDHSIVTALIESAFNSYFDRRKLDKISKYQNTKAVIMILSDIYYLYRIERLNEEALLLDTSGLDLSSNNYVNIDEVDLFAYMKPFIWADSEEEEIHYGLALLGKYIVLDTIYGSNNNHIEKVNFFKKSSYSEFLFTFIRIHFNDKLTEAVKKGEELKQKRLQAMMLNNFNLVANDFKEIISKYTTADHAKAHLEVSLDFDYREILVSFKIGDIKPYVVSNIYDFFNSFRTNERKEYGKHFIFTHNINNLVEPYKSLIKLLLEFPLSSSYKKALPITPDLASHILEILKGEHIHLDGKLVLLGLSPKKLKVEITDEMVLKVGLKENQHILHLVDDLYIVDEDAAIVYKVEDNSRYKQFISLACKLNGTNLEPVIERFNDEIYPYINNYLEISPMVQNRFKVSDLEIIAYFDYNNKILSVKESFKHDGIEIKRNEFKTQDQRKYDEYLAYLDVLGFEDGVCQSEDLIYDFMAMDFSHLRELASVYLSEAIQNHQVLNFQKPVIKINYNSGIMECFMEDTEYDEEELFKLYQGMKLHKKYVLLKNNRIVQIEDDEMAQAMDELHIDKKHPYESVSLPIYQALCAYAHKDMIKIDDYLRNMIDELTDFKNSKVKLPDVNASLRPYQIEGFNWLSILAKYHMGGILADDMGLGKTLQIITLIAASPDSKPSLIVCPKSLIFNWKNEFEKFAPDILVYQIYGGLQARKDLIDSISNDKKTIYITAYDSLRNDIDLYKDKIFKYIILDEAQYIKNVQAEKSLAVKKLKGDSKFALTGTPIENNVIDLWSIFEFVMPGYFEELSVFKVKYNSNDNYPSHIAKKIAPFVLRRTKNNVLKDLPAKFETIIQAPMTPAQRKLYDAHLMMARNSLANGAKAFDILPFILRLRQICVDPRTFQEGNEEGGKLQMLHELIVKYIDEGHKILIFSQFVKCLNLIEDILASLHLKYYMITGDTKPENRIEYASRFNASDEVKIFLVSLKAGGTGLNLVGADVVIHMDPWWNQAVESQATDRAYRIGQKRNVEVIKLICENTIEERVIELQNMKRDIIDKIISNDESSVTSASLEDIHFVLK